METEMHVKSRLWLVGQLDTSEKEELTQELSSVVWYCSQLARELGVDAKDISKAESLYLPLKKRKGAEARP
jgi:hypothetical protein